MKNSAFPVRRCTWCGTDPLYVAYHDDEWGVPVQDDTKLFEMISLEGAQAGLSWLTVLRKREGYRELFDGFDANMIARYNERRIASILRDERIIRNRLKVGSVVKNSRAFLRIKERYGSFAEFVWRYVDFVQKQNSWKHLTEVPARTAESDAMSRDLRREGFSFVGSTICYAFMQAVGLVNDHTTNCFRHADILGMSRKKALRKNRKPTSA